MALVKQKELEAAMGLSGSSEQKKSARRGRPKKPNSPADSSRGTVVALDRGLRALICLAENGTASLADIARDTGTPAATAHRILMTLQQRGLAKNAGSSGQWAIGPQAYRIGLAYKPELNLVEIASPILRQLSRETGETVNLATEDNGELLYIAQVESDNPVRASIKNGTPSHFHTSGVGKAILAFMGEDGFARIVGEQPLASQTNNSITETSALIEELAEVRKRGWALDDEERFSGLRCVAAPIFDPLGRAIAGVSVSAPSSRIPNDQLPRIASAVKSAASRASDLLREAS